jgi:hypothetical protein
MDPKDEQEFSAAFAEFTSGEPASAAPGKTPEELAAEAAAAADPVKTAEELAAEAAASAAAASGKTPEELAAEAAAAPVKTAEELAAEAAASAAPAKTPEELAAEAAVAAVKPVKNPEIEALQAEIAALKATQPAPVGAAQPAPVEAAPVYTADEQAALTKYQEDWPDIAAGEALLRRAEYKELVAYVFQQVQEYYAPVQEFFQTRSGKDQYSDIVALVPDYDVVRDKALAWIAGQPAYLKAAYTQVANEGSPKDVADMITRFKTETGYAAAALPVTPAIVPVVAAALPVAAVKAAKALAVVKSARSEQSQGVDENDFEGAFKEFAAKEEAQRVVRK